MTPEQADEYTAGLGQIAAGTWRVVALGIELGVPRALGIPPREWVEDRLGGYVKLALPERREVVAELTAPVEDGGHGMTQRDAADVLGVSQATVSADQNRSPDPPDQGESSPADQNRSDDGAAIREQAAIGNALTHLANLRTYCSRLARGLADEATVELGLTAGGQLPDLDTLEDATDVLRHLVKDHAP